MATELPNVTNISDQNGALTFMIQNTETCVVNSIRRTALSNIETLVFRGFPHESSNINIVKNTTNFNNEYLKQRISAIPVMNSDRTTFESFRENYKAVVEMENKTPKTKHVTTEHIKIVNKTTNQEMPREQVVQYFPPDPITGDFIIICTLYPNHGGDGANNEMISFECDFDIGTSQENSCWNVVHNSSYEFLRNETEIAKQAEKIDDVAERRDFELLEAQRIYHKNEYRMLFETLGIYTNREIVELSCEYIIGKLNLVIQYLKPNENATILGKDEMLAKATDGTSTMEELETLNQVYCNLYSENGFYVLELKEDDYTIGKLIENYLYKFKQDKIKFVGFKKTHPTLPNALIYIKYKTENVASELVFNHLITTVTSIITIFQEIQRQIKNN